MHGVKSSIQTWIFKLSWIFLTIFFGESNSLPDFHFLLFDFPQS